MWIIVRLVHAASVLLALVLIAAPIRNARGYDLVVAQDGSGDYSTVQAAILAVPDRRPGRASIFIKAGTYDENITVTANKPRLTLVGEDRDTTIITGDGYTPVRGDSVYGILTCYVQAKDFGAINLTFSNTAGDVGQGTFAMWIEGNRAHFKNCALRGYQDTLYTSGQKAYFKSCFIEGAIDFIFGPSTAVFKGCTLHCLDSGYITEAETPEGREYGFVFKDCTIYGDAPQGTVYLGRALLSHANVVYLHCDMDAEIAPEGWADFTDGGEDTIFFAEYGCSGDGADTADRVPWARDLDADADDNYTLSAVFNLPAAFAGFGMIAVVTTPWYAAF